MPFLLRGGSGDMWETDGNMRGDVSTCISKFEFSGDEILGLHLMRDLTVRYCSLYNFLSIHVSILSPQFMIRLFLQMPRAIRYMILTTSIESKFYLV